MRELVLVVARICHRLARFARSTRPRRPGSSVRIPQPFHVIEDHGLPLITIGEDSRDDREPKP